MGTKMQNPLYQIKLHNPKQIKGGKTIAFVEDYTLYIVIFVNRGCIFYSTVDIWSVVIKMEKQTIEDSYMI